MIYTIIGTDPEGWGGANGLAQTYYFFDFFYHSTDPDIVIF